MVEWVAGTGHAMRADMDGRTIRGAARARFHRLSRVGWLVAGAACLAASPAGAAAAAEAEDCCTKKDGKMSACCEKAAKGEKMACCDKHKGDDKKPEAAHDGHAGR